MGSKDSPKRPFLCCYDYGMGGVWVYVKARTKAEIEEAFDLVAFEERPAWMDEETLQRDFGPSQLPTFDIDRPEGWILSVKREAG
jgi:hypothetical protein